MLCPDEGRARRHLLDLLAPNTVFFHFLAVDVLLIDNDRRVEKLLRGLLAFVELLVYELHGGLGHPDGVLAYRRGLLTLADGLKRLRGAVDADDVDVLVAARRLVATGGVYGPYRPDGVVVVGAEDGVDFLVRLQNVGRHVQRLLLVEVGRLVGDDLYVRVLLHDPLEALLPVRGGGGADEALEVNDVALRFAVALLEQIHDIVRGLLARLYVVRLDLAGELAAVGAAVEGEDGYVGVVGRLDGRHDALGVYRDEDERVHVLRDQVLRLIELRARVAVGVGLLELEAVLFGPVLDALLQPDEEGVVERGTGEADGFATLLTPASTRARRQDQHQRGQYGHPQHKLLCHRSSSTFRIPRLPRSQPHHSLRIFSL